MKTLLYTMLTLALAMCLTITVFAAPSKSNAVEVAGAVDSNGAAAVYNVTDTTIPYLTEEILVQVLNANGIEVTADQVSVLWQKDITSDVKPITIKFHVDGTKDAPLYVLHYNGTEWELIKEGVGEDIEATFTSLSPVAVATKITAPDSGTKSPQTGASAATVGAFGIALAACAAAVVISRKKS